MDTLSHALWGKGLFGYRKYRWFSILFGCLPDLMSFGLYSLYQIVTNPFNLKFGKPLISEIPYWVFGLYDFSHSFVIASIAIVVVYFFNKDFCFPMLAWPFHILLDFFTHSIRYFPTPVLWPVSDYRFDGIPWSNPYIMLVNFVLIFLIFIYRKRRDYQAIG